MKPGAGDGKDVGLGSTGVRVWVFCGIKSCLTMGKVMNFI